MSRFDPKNIYDRPQIQMVPLIDVLFFTLVFFMVLSVYYHLEAQMDIHIPQATSAHDIKGMGTQIVINVTVKGKFIVNGRVLSDASLESMLHQLTALSQQQSVIIRADQKTYHKYVIEVLDACARNNIRDVSFATSENQE
jgi:biopolymer transport protein ExbD